MKQSQKASFFLKKQRISLFILILIFQKCSRLYYSHIHIQNTLKSLIMSQSYYKIQPTQNMNNELEQAFEMANYGNSVKDAEQILDRLRRAPDYPMLLLGHLNNNITYQGKLRAAIELKTWCEAYKNMEEFQRTQFQYIIEDLKTNILFAFLSFTEKIQKTLLPAIVSLSAIQYPDRWSGLVNGLVTYSRQHDNQNSRLKILQLMAQITNKYSYLTRSDPLYSEINQTIDAFHNFLLSVTRKSIENIFQNQQNPVFIKILEQEMILFYNLNYQDLHPLFEDNLQEWMSILNRVMKLPDTNQHFFKCKGAALQSILLYASKYKEDVEDSIKGFSQQIWSLCANALPDPEYDEVVFSALKYFRSLIMWKDMKEFFASNINNLISNLILPNLAFTNNYKDLFNEEIQTFIGYYFRNAELNSRRSAALELLQALVRNYPVFQNFLQSQFQSFNHSDQNSQGLCLLLTLVIQSAPKGFRDVDGATQLLINEDVIKYCYNNFVKNFLGKMFNKNIENPEKSIESKMSLVEILTTLRYIFYFRIYLPVNDLTLIVKLCCTLQTTNDSLKEILFLMVNAMLNLRHGNYLLYKDFVYYFNAQNVKEVGSDIIKFISARNDEDNTALNISATRLLCSTMKTLKGSAEQFYQYQISPLLISMLKKTDQFDFYCVLNLFQAIGYLAYWLCRNKSQFSRTLQTTIQQYFHKIIEKQSDMINFCFQIFSIFLQMLPGDVEFYRNVYASIIRMENWNQGNQSIMSSYVQYISSFITVDQNKIVEDKGIYQTILGRLIELDNFELFCRFVKRILKVCGIQNFYNAGYMEVLVKGTDFISQKSLEGRKVGLQFIFDIANEYSTETVIKCLNSVRNGFFEEQLLNNQEIIQTIQTFRFRKLMYNAICNALASKCLSTVETQVTMLNLLVENCTGRFRRETLGLLAQSAAAAKKEATYQKLTVFKEIQSSEPPLYIDEEILLIQAFQRCNERNPDIQNLVTDKTREKIQRLWEKNQNN